VGEGRCWCSTSSWFRACFSPELMTGAELTNGSLSLERKMLSQGSRVLGDLDFATKVGMTKHDQGREGLDRESPIRVVCDDQDMSESLTAARVQTGGDPIPRPDEAVVRS